MTLSAKKQTDGSPSVCPGAADRGRTGTVSLPRDFKSLVSACSTTAAYCDIILQTKRIVNSKIEGNFILFFKFNVDNLKRI